ncbi:MAG: hypothetical protein A4E49_01099 [Methanosaeta sp. PtaU1.Bin112]|nr:MAG: hypothetical protein A4E49_01099 [Methanosaeta sp. PtaU1.Bin112]
MKGLTALQLLDVWEQGHAYPISQRSLLLLAAARDDLEMDDLLSMSIGKIDAALMDLRDLTFGPMINCLESCPVCNSLLDLPMRMPDLKANASDISTESFSIISGEYEIDFRLPTGSDLIAISGHNNIEKAKDLVLRRCITQIRRNGLVCSNIRSNDILIPERSREEISKRMREIDPQANIEINLICPSCGSDWQRVFDIATFFCMEIDIWALRTLREVHILASAYGWSEKEIVGMSQWKRQLYMEMVGK